MERCEIMRRAIEFDSPPRLPFWQRVVDFAPQDVWDTWELDRAEAGWFFDDPRPDDWGCIWAVTEKKNMGQVVGHPLADWAALDTYRPPNGRNPFYFDRLEDALAGATDHYVMLTSHFNLLERLCMLRGFESTMLDFFDEPAKVDRVLDMILEFKLELLDELARRLGDRVHGVFLTDDWGTQQGTFVSRATFDEFFASRYRTLFDGVHSHGWHAVLHSCGRVNDFVPAFIEAGVDVLNLQQPQAYGLVEFGRQFAGKVCFLTTVDIQSTLPAGHAAAVRDEARQLVQHWSTPEGGFIVFNYGDPEALAVPEEMTDVMFDEFVKLKDYWTTR